MKPTVPCNDEALLLLLHGELPLWAKLRMRLHLWGCPSCRERAQQYSQLSVGLATQLSRPGHTPRFRPSTLFFPSPLWLIPSLILVIVGSFGAVLLQWRRLEPPHRHSAAGATLKDSTHPCKTKDECIK